MKSALELHRLLRVDAYPIAVAVLDDRHEAEDLLQEVFLDFWLNQTKFDLQKGADRPWIRIVARTRAIDRLRQRQSRERLAGSVIALTANGSLSPDEGAERSDRGRRLHLALAELPDNQRQTLQLCFFEGLSHSEVARVTSTPLGTVKTRSRAGLRGLARLMAVDVQRPRRARATLHAVVGGSRCVPSRDQE